MCCSTSSSKSQFSSFPSFVKSSSLHTNTIFSSAFSSTLLIGVHFLKGIFSLKNGTKIVLLIMRTSPFKGTCLLIQVKQAKNALYGPHIRCYKPIFTQVWKSDLGIFAVNTRNGAKSSPARLIFQFTNSNYLCFSTNQSVPVIGQR